LIRPSINAAGLPHSDTDQPNVYRHHLQVAVNGKAVLALIDSGNSWRSAISEDFFFSLGFEATDITPIRQQSLTTAKQGANLDVLGKCRVKMTLTSPGNRTKWTFNPIIVRSLAMDCNLSGSYLMRNKWDHLYSRHALLIQGTEVPLVQAPVTQRSVSAVYTTDASTILLNSGKYVTLIAPDVRKGFQNNGDMYLRGDHSFMDRLDVHPSLNAIVHCNREGLTYGAIINTLGIPMDIPKGTRFGTVTSTCSKTDLGLFPGHIATLGTTSDLTGPQRRKVDRKEYIKAFLTRSREEVMANKSSSKGTNPPFDPNTCDDKRKREWLQDNFDLKSSPFIESPSDLRSAENCLLQF
jgi:hypothetical protein